MLDTVRLFITRPLWVLGMRSCWISRMMEQATCSLIRIKLAVVSGEIRN
jgi:hypothetical protein